VKFLMEDATSSRHPLDIAMPDFSAQFADLRATSARACQLIDLVNFLLDEDIMKTVATNEAKTHLSALLQKVSAGETIIIARGRQPLAKLVPYEGARSVRPKVGEMLDRRRTVPAAALLPLSESELRTWGLQ
jgi:antitoxin (DNA-binding transcriptional repressor) of toxin-antitoxin stability system